MKATSLRRALLRMPCCLLPLAATLAGAAEEEPVVDAASLVQPALLSGPGFSVDPHVELRGYMARFTLDTPYGPLQADSVEILAEREAELPALEALEKVTRSEAFLRAAGDRIGTTAKALANVVLHPIDSVTGIPAGVARYFSERLAKIGTQAQSASDRVARRFGNEGDPYPDDDGPMTDGRDDAAGEPPRKKHWYSSIAREAGREFKRQVKYGKAKREIAQRLGIDPYTRNPYAQERLSALAWVGSAGDFGAGGALGTIGGVGAGVLAQGLRVNSIVWKLAPDDLRARNRERLQRHCRDELLIRQFLRRGAFSPTLQTAFADALDALQPAQGCDDVLELGMTADSDLEARFLVNALRLLDAHLGARAKQGTLQRVGAGLAYKAANGELVLPLPVDRLSATTDVERFLDRPEFRVKNKTVLIGGDASLAARRALTERGWNIVIGVRRAGAPPYARSGEPSPVDVD
ncbi:hypothetical protein [Dokdonella fugitiva]|jgi:hypothetical protein|uniref:Uncharacterized protein n=1 Tax=Dokdonella fugitiva TaxID=328517 RepID=A0A4R2I6G7_9GAMM|nr:hypothetical protein [Dokdonella fugitiva]TCO38778.1 hypothetical protein EV148_10766 [Dokdonella fugitiva]